MNMTKFYNCPYCECKYESNDETPLDIYYIRCECGKLFSFRYYCDCEPEYRVSKLLFPERDDAKNINEERLLLGLFVSRFDGNYEDYVNEKNRLLSMLTPTTEVERVVVYHDGVFSFSLVYNADDYNDSHYAYSYIEFENVTHVWNRTSQFNIFISKDNKVVEHPKYTLDKFTKRMADEFGIDVQDNKLFEELNELMVTLYNWKMCHDDEDRYTSMGDVISEIADVRLTIEQFERNHGIQSLVSQKMKFKQHRTEKRCGI